MVTSSFNLLCLYMPVNREVVRIFIYMVKLMDLSLSSLFISICPLKDTHVGTVS